MLLIEFKGEVIVDSCWIPQNPNMIAVLESEGILRLYNLAETVEKPKDLINLPKSSAGGFLSIVASSSTNTISAITSDGEVVSVFLGQDLSDDRFLLDKVYVS